MKTAVPLPSAYDSTVPGVGHTRSPSSSPNPPKLAVHPKEPVENRSAEGASDSRGKVVAISQVGLFALALLYTIHIAKPILLPVVLAVLFSFLLAPAVTTVRGYGLPRGLASVIVLVSVTLSAGFALASLFGPAAEWIAEAPTHVERVEDRIRVILEPVEQMSQAADEVEEALGGEEEGALVSMESETLFDFLLARARALLGGLVITWALILFFLSSGDLFLRKLVRVLPELKSRKRAVRVSRTIRANLSHHLLTVTVINSALGLTVGTTLALLGMPNPVLWGAMAAVLNYVPYVGALIGVGVVGMVSMSTFEALVPWYLVLGCVYFYYVFDGITPKANS